MPYCSICEQSVNRWLPHPYRDQMGQFMRLVGAVGSNLDLYGCPNCGCNDRDRHLWLYMQTAGIVDAISELRVLHLAPEDMVERKIAALDPRTYVRGNLVPRRPDHRKLNVEDLPFEKKSFDLILCNHVLEHVDYPERALREIARCLTSEGQLVAQTPYAPNLKNTFEMSEPVSPYFARLFYGQDDHVRLFGADLLDQFEAAGLKGDLASHSALLGDFDPIEYGCNDREPFFLFEHA